MKNRIFYYYAVLLITIMLDPFDCYALETGKPTFLMPAALKTIDKEAFTNTSVETIIVQDNITTIEQRAFADNPYLENCFIAPSVESIADDTFDNDKNVVIWGVWNDCGDKWERTLGFPFLYCDFGKPYFNGEKQRSIGSEFRFNFVYRRIFVKIINMNGRHFDEGKSLRPQERSELHIIDIHFP